MTKICLIIEEIKDNNFQNNSEKLNYLILNALLENNYVVDIFCLKNNILDESKINSIKLFDKHDFIKNALLIAENLKYDFTFATDYLPTDIVYIHKHSMEFFMHNLKSKFRNLIMAIFQNKKFKIDQRKAYKQKLNIEKSKIIFTPSSLLKNDLINYLAIDGQKIYILPPYFVQDKNIKYKSNEVFTFGVIVNNLYENILLLLKAVQKLSDFDFRLKIFYKSLKYKKIIEFLIKKLKLNDKIELIYEKEYSSDIIDSIDSLILISQNQTFGLNALEAMAKGKIVIVNSKCGIKDIIEQESNGFIFDVTKNPTNNLVKLLKYIIFNKDNFENLKQKAIYTASTLNIEKFKIELDRILIREKNGF